MLLYGDELHGQVLGKGLLSLKVHHRRRPNPSRVRHPSARPATDIGILPTSVVAGGTELRGKHGMQGDWQPAWVHANFRVGHEAKQQFLTDRFALARRPCGGLPLLRGSPGEVRCHRVSLPQPPPLHCSRSYAVRPQCSRKQHCWSALRCDAVCSCWPCRYWPQGSRNWSDVFRLCSTTPTHLRDHEAFFGRSGLDKR